jgi:hypothetical protein
MAELKRGRGLIRVSKNRLLEFLKLPKTYDIVVIKMSKMSPTMIDITVEGPDLATYRRGYKLPEIHENEGENE